MSTEFIIEGQAPSLESCSLVAPACSSRSAVQVSESPSEYIHFVLRSHTRFPVSTFWVLTASRLPPELARGSWEPRSRSSVGETCGPQCTLVAGHGFFLHHAERYHGEPEGAGARS